MKSKKNKRLFVKGVFNGSLETYTRYFQVADEEQKKKGLNCF